MNNKIFLITFMLFSYLLIIFSFVFILPSFNFVISLVFGVVLFFVVLGTAAGLYDYLDSDNNPELDNLNSEDLIHENEKINFALKNSSYHGKKKHRRRYYRERTGKGFKDNNKGLKNKDKYYKDKYGTALKAAHYKQG